MIIKNRACTTDRSLSNQFNLVHRLPYTQRFLNIDSRLWDLINTNRSLYINTSWFSNQPKLQHPAVLLSFSFCISTMSMELPPNVPIQPPLDVNGTIGAMVLGGLVTAMYVSPISLRGCSLWVLLQYSLYGIELLQVLAYWRNSKQDLWFTKLAVSYLICRWLLCTY
jgi:hypothetical protein